MLKIKIRKTGNDSLLVFAFYLLLLQNPLGKLLPVFQYADEAFSLIGVLILGSQAVQRGRLTIKKSSATVIGLLVIFAGTGLLGNLLFQYQPMRAVLTDFWTNLKFFFSIVSGYVLFQICRREDEKNVITGHARFVSLVLFVLLLLDLGYKLFPTMGMRYGLRAVQLFYGHPTYLAVAFFHIFLSSFTDFFSNVKI